MEVKKIVLLRNQLSENSAVCGFPSDMLNAQPAVTRYIGVIANLEPKAMSPAFHDRY